MRSGFQGICHVSPVLKQHTLLTLSPSIFLSLPIAPLLFLGLLVRTGMLRRRGRPHKPAERLFLPPDPWETLTGKAPWRYPSPCKRGPRLHGSLKTTWAPSFIHSFLLPPSFSTSLPPSLLSLYEHFLNTS